VGGGGQCVEVSVVLDICIGSLCDGGLCGAGLGGGV